MDGSTIHTENSVALDAAELRTALNFASQTVERRNTIPVIGTLRLTVQDCELRICSTDLDILSEISVTPTSATEDAAFDTTISPPVLRQLLRYAEGDITLMQNGDILSVFAGDMKSRIREVCAAADFPEFAQTIVWSEPITVSQAALHKALSAVAVCISSEATRYYLNGIYLHREGETLRAVATDGHRLARYDADMPWPFDSLILPRKTAQLLLRRLVNSNQTATIRTGKTQGGDTCIRVQAENWSITSKTIDGTFPDYDRVIPKAESTHRVTISHTALRRFPPTGPLSYTFTINPDKGVMTLSSLDNGHETEMPVIGVGGPFGFNLSYLLDFSQRAEALRIEGTSAADPFRIYTDDPALLYVLMPRRA